MKVILRENIENLGKRGDIVSVARGYGRNFLIPRKLALEVTPSNMNMVEQQQKSLRKKLEKEVQTYKVQIEKINQIRLSFVRKAGDKDSIFGSVSLSDISKALEDKGFEFEKKKILLSEPIKKLGSYKIPLKVFHDERAEITVEVVKESEGDGEHPVADTPQVAEPEQAPASEAPVPEPEETDAPPADAEPEAEASPGEADEVTAAEPPAEDKAPEESAAEEKAEPDSIETGDK
jgi:large subunit ribosomal protein L9